MKFTFLIPTINNYNHLKICINSIRKNSKFNHQILVHSNNSTDETSNYLKSQSIYEMKSDKNYGLCTALNNLVKKAENNFLIFIHDDMYLCPGWENVLINEINSHNNYNFYLSGVMIEKINGHINYNFGDDYRNFDEKNLLKMYSQFKFDDIQGADKNPSVVHISLWEKVGGLSEEFNPGDASDPDFTLKLWKSGIRIFKGLSNFRVYHFGSMTTRKNKNIKLNRGSKIFLQKWGFTYKFFQKYYLEHQTKYIGPLNEPKKSIFYYFHLFICKLQLIFNYIKN
jgi:GT2 family glycosyltransferase